MCKPQASAQYDLDSQGNNLMFHNTTKSGYDKIRFKLEASDQLCFDSGVGILLIVNDDDIEKKYLRYRQFTHQFTNMNYIDYPFF